MSHSAAYTALEQRLLYLTHLSHTPFFWQAQSFISLLQIPYPKPSAPLLPSWLLLSSFLPLSFLFPCSFQAQLYPACHPAFPHSHPIRHLYSSHSHQGYQVWPGQHLQPHSEQQSLHFACKHSHGSFCASGSLKLVALRGDSKHLM